MILFHPRFTSNVVDIVSESDVPTYEAVFVAQYVPTFKVRAGRDKRGE